MIIITSCGFANYIFQCEGVTDPVQLQMTANSLALMARSLSFNSEFMSPFAINARRNNINATGAHMYIYNLHLQISYALYFVLMQYMR